MKISTMYDRANNIKNERISAFVYKMNKVLVNTVYPIMVKLEKGIDESSKIIVSLTSFPERINTVWLTIATLLKQTIKPKSILLWLSIEQFPNEKKDLPKKLLELEKYGLTIRFCDNLYPHKKYYYTMLENPEVSVITVDDDVFYPEYLIEELMKTSAKYPKTVCCTWAHRIEMDNQGNVIPYEYWRHGIKNGEKPDIRILPVGIGGVLYPPHCLDSQVFDKERINELCLRTDDLWLKSMAVLKGTSSVRINKSYKRTFFTILRTQKNGLVYENVGKNKNDEAMRKIIESYPIVQEILGKAENNEK